MPVPDLVISQLAATPTRSDEPLTLNLVVGNQGSKATTGGFRIHLYADHGGSPTTSDPPLAWVDVPAMGVGASRSVSMTLPAGTLPWGNHTFWAVADGNGGHAERNELNNAAVLQMALSQPPGAMPWTWGSNTDGQLGDGGTASQATQVRVSGLNNVVAVAAGARHSLALKTDGTVWAWGDNSEGQLGDGTTTDRLTPVRVSGLTNIVAVAAGTRHSLALKSDGTVWAWGNDAEGQLGDDLTLARKTAPVQVAGLSKVVGIAAGGDHSLARKADGTAWAWGANVEGQLGDGTTTRRPTPIQVPGLTGIIGVSAGLLHSLALKWDGAVLAWGNNANGELGDGTLTDRRIPGPVSGLVTVIAISAGARHNLALKADGTVWAWGNNDSGELGDGTTTDRPAPVQVKGLVGARVIAAGGRHSLALDNGGFVMAWGFTGTGLLGEGTVSATSFKTTPTSVTGYGGVKAIAASLDSHSLAIRDPAYDKSPGPAPDPRQQGPIQPGNPTSPDGRTGPLPNSKPGNPSPR